MNNEITTRGQLINDTSTKTTVGLMALGSCELAVLVVGGGGKGGYRGGGGSGFVELSTLRFAGLTDLQATVGGENKKSVVSVEGKVEVEAGAGAQGSTYIDSSIYAGGAGYSGGGAGGSSAGAGGAGGTDGQNSTPGAGGKGSGLEVESIFLEDFGIT